jgi:SAM-dependent methyltransferase
MFTVVHPNARDCKICGAPSPLFGVVDFHKSCIEAQGKRLPLSGRPIYYRRCTACGFAFTEEFDDWSNEAFLAQIYNSSYIQVDPDYAGARALSNATAVADILRASRDSIAILDFGGGNGIFARHLFSQGFSATTYDPFSEFNERPTRQFNLITCFEVMEHTPFPARTAAEMCDLLANEGIILFSTLTQPADFDQQRLHWWYAGPRNGHVSLYSRESLTILFQQLGLKLFSISELVHVAYRKLPAFAAHLVREGHS